MKAHCGVCGKTTDFLLQGTSWVCSNYCGYSIPFLKARKVILAIILIAMLFSMAFTTYLPVVSSNSVTLVNGRIMQNFFVGVSSKWAALAEIFCNEEKTQCVWFLDTSYGHLRMTDEDGYFQIPVPSQKIYVLLWFDGEYCLPGCIHVAPYDDGIVMATETMLDMGEVLIP